MLPYDLTLDDLLGRFSEQRLIEITDTTSPSPATIDDSAVERAAIDAIAEFERHAGRYYVTPIDPVPAWLRLELVDLWAWRLLFNCRPDWLEVERRGDGFSWTDRRRELVSWLESLSSPKRAGVLPGCTEQSERVSPTGVACQPGSRRMTVDALRRLP